MNNQISKAFIALGSNLENPVSQIQLAIEELQQIPSTRLVCHSSLYRTAPVGHCDQPDFVNAVALIETRLAPHDLLEMLLTIERNHGRMRYSLNEPRTLDLDILLYDELQCQDKVLTIPHPRMSQRAFVLKPLMEIAPDCQIPGYGPIAPLLISCHQQQIEQIKA